MFLYALFILCLQVTVALSTVERLLLFASHLSINVVLYPEHFLITKNPNMSTESVHRALFLSTRAVGLPI